MDTEASNAIFLPAIVPRLFPALGPAVLISVGYIDVGKWAIAVDGGTHFGFDLMLFMLAFNCIAILFQYLTACITVATGKNISQICREEYDRPTCTFLGIQAVLSMIVLDLTTTMGIAHGLNLLLGLDLFVCVILSAIDAMLFPLFITLMNKCKTEIFVGTASFVLLIYVFGVLISQSDTPLSMSVSLPMLRGENAYILMGLLGTNIMPHNFYIHSFIIQKQSTLLKLSMGTLCYDHFLAILFIFSGIFLVNYMVMLSAATVFHSAGLSVLTFQDTLLLMDQVFQSPIAPFAFFLVLFISSQVTALTCALGGQGVLHDFFGIEPPVWLYRFTVKALATMPALYCAWNFGAEEIYQLLIFSQIISAMLLPSSVIPLLRASSSTSIMGAFKISSFMEILGLFAFLWMLASNAIFVVEMLSGSSSWMSNLGWCTGSGMTLPYLFVLVTACASIALMLWLAATPLKSASERPNIQMCSLDVQQDLPALCENTEEDGLKINDIRFDREEEPLSGKATLEKSVVGQLDNSVEFNLGLAETITPSSYEPHSSAGEENFTLVSSSLTSNLEVPTSTVKQASVETVNDISSDESAVKRTEYKDPVGNTGVEGDIVAVVKDDKESYVWEPEESPAGTSENLAISACEGPGSSRSVTGKSEEVGSGSGSLSRLAGLGKSARRQLAAILDEFWGQLYDFHGQAIQEAKPKGIDANLGLEQKSSAKADIVGVGYAMNYFSDAEQRSMCLTKSKDCESTRQQRMMGSSESSYEAQKANPLLSSYIQSLNAYVQNSSNDLLDASERRYSSLRLPSYSEDRDYQPATIHGYQISSYLSRIAERNMHSMSMPSDPSTPKSSPFIPNYRDTLTYSVGQNGLGSLHASNVQNPAVPATTRLQAARPYCESSLVGTSENVGSSVSSKKYHSLPDISGLIIPTRNTSSANRNAQWSNSVGPEPSAGQSPFEQPLYASTASRATGVPLAFDELSPSNRYRDPFSLPPISSFDTKSLWSKQPFEQLFGIPGKPRSRGHEGLLQGTISHTESEAKLLLSFRCCITKLQKLEGSDWLFQQNGGFDEELIDQVAARYKFLYEAEDRGGNRVPVDDPHISSDQKFGLSEDGFVQHPVPSVPYCGDGCIWQVGLIVSFGVWCIRRILELSIMETRPEFWGKYTYVLNRLQGILDLAFFKPRPSISPCFCLQIPSMHVKKTSPRLRHGLSPTTGKAVQGQYTSAGMLLDLIKDVEAAVSGRKGRTGTAAGDVAFPKGKENLASVLKRYKRRLSNKSAGTHEGGPGSRKIPTAFSTQLLG